MSGALEMAIEAAANLNEEGPGIGAAGYADRAVANALISIAQSLETMAELGPVREKLTRLEQAAEILSTRVDA